MLFTHFICNGIHRMAYSPPEWTWNHLAAVGRRRRRRRGGEELLQGLVSDLCRSTSGSFTRRGSPVFFCLRSLHLLTRCHHGGHFDVDVFRYHGAGVSVLHHLHVVMGEMRSERMGGGGRRWWWGNLRRSCFAARTMVRTIQLLLYRFAKNKGTSWIKVDIFACCIWPGSPGMKCMECKANHRDVCISTSPLHGGWGGKCTIKCNIVHT